ncbi:hypothetical protein [Aestuariirhabdus sp. LZHN29]|uniref:hypothetical protein n=1 Tax=Aestuariirhabdus sp. LZHN29 TaxID=3417462 RepID=UPI003CF4D36A
MAWKKKGLIYCPDGKLCWSTTHAQIPTPIKLSEQVLRVYFSTRDSKGVSRTSYVDVDIDNPSRVISVCDDPVLDVGRPGLHDDCGAMPFCVIKDREGFKFYYTGWHIPKTVSYDLSIALAVSDNLDEFIKISEGPIAAKSFVDPYWVAAPCVLLENGRYRMWYISAYGWVEIASKLEPVYNIKYAESNDGIRWDFTGDVCVDAVFEYEALGRPWVIREGEIYKMWYSSRGSKGYREAGGEHYTIGYAESFDGINWTRMDERSSLTTSQSGWDSEMVEYASVYIDNERKYMFYNGNGFGKSGFGYAEYFNDR